MTRDHLGVRSAFRRGIMGYDTVSEFMAAAIGWRVER